MSVPVKRFWQLAVLILFAVGVAVVLMDFTYRDLQEDFARRETLRRAETLQFVFNAELKNDSLLNSPKKITERLASFKILFRQNGFENAYWYDGKTRQVWPAIANTASTDIDSLLRSNQAALQHLRLFTSLSGRSWLVAVPIRASGYLILAQKRPVAGWFTADFWRRFGPLIIVFSLIVFLIFLVVYHSLKQPLSSVRHLAEHLQAGDYRYRIEYSKKDEFTDTFMRINQSLERLGAGDESYHQKEAHIRNLLEALDESIVVLDTDLKLNTFNPAAVRLLRCSSEAEFERCFASILEENMALRDLIRRFQTLQEKTLSRELVVWISDERELHINVTLQRLDENHFLLTFKDLSRIKELQNNLLRSMKFGIIANLVSSVSHEIRNPLSAVGIHTEILSTRLHKEYPELDPKLKKSLNIIQNEIKRIHRIHTQFFNLARKRELKLTALKPNSVIDDVIQLVQHHALEQQINLEINLDANIDFIYGDVDQLKQVILNVVLNAFQAVGEDGQVSIKTGQDSQKVYIEIADNGPGISPEVGEHIFDLYFTTKPDGGGIGLALCKKIVEAHEGRIWFRSTPGQGATFTIALPRISQTRKERIQTRLTNLNK